MKTRLTTLSIFASLSVFADDSVVVNSPTDVIVNGAPANFLVDAVRNFPKVPTSAFHDGLIKWVNDQVASNAAALKAKDDASKAAADKAAADTKAAADKATAAEKEQARLLAVAESIKSAAKIEDAKALADQATKPKTEREIVELKSKKAEIEAQIAEREARVTAKKAGK